MKKIFLILNLAIAIVASGQTTNLPAGQTGSEPFLVKNTPRTQVPADVLTNDSTHWTISTLSTIGYVNTTPGPNFNSYKSGGGMIVKFRFKEGGTFEFILYIQANTYGIDTETWTQFEGTVEFFKNEKGHNFMRTYANKGTYRITKNGQTTTRPIPVSDLKAQHSNTYIWERTTLKDDANNDYLLMVDLDAHPNAAIDKAGSIDPSWVSKFHIPRKK